MLSHNIETVCCEFVTTAYCEWRHFTVCNSVLNHSKSSEPNCTNNCVALGSSPLGSCGQIGPVLIFAPLLTLSITEVTFSRLLQVQCSKSPSTQNASVLYKIVYWYYRRICENQEASPKRLNCSHWLIWFSLNNSVLSFTLNVSLVRKLGRKTQQDENADAVPQILSSGE